jgi:hypothetical protein
MLQTGLRSCLRDKWRIAKVYHFKKQYPQSRTFIPGNSGDTLLNYGKKPEHLFLIDDGTDGGGIR